MDSLHLYQFFCPKLKKPESKVKEERVSFDFCCPGINNLDQKENHFLKGCSFPVNVRTLKVPKTINMLISGAAGHWCLQEASLRWDSAIKTFPWQRGSLICLFCVTEDASFSFCFPLTVQQPDPNQPKAEGAQMVPMRGEQLGVVTNWPPSLEAALQRWGTISPKAPCLTTMDTNGKPLYVLTYGRSLSGSGSSCGTSSSVCSKIRGHADALQDPK